MGRPPRYDYFTGILINSNESDSSCPEPVTRFLRSLFWAAFEIRKPFEDRNRRT
jgi:hypothetical protein